MANPEAFLAIFEQLTKRLNVAKKQSLKDIYQLICDGSMPAMYNGKKRTGKVIMEIMFKP